MGIAKGCVWVLVAGGKSTTRPLSSLLSVSFAVSFAVSIFLLEIFTTRAHCGAPQGPTYIGSPRASISRSTTGRARATTARHTHALSPDTRRYRLTHIHVPHSSRTSATTHTHKSYTPTARPAASPSPRQPRITSIHRVSLAAHARHKTPYSVGGARRRRPLITLRAPSSRSHSS